MSGFEAIFGVVSGGAGLVSLGMQLTDSAMRLRKLYRTAKTAPKALNELSEKLETMVMLLHLLNQHQSLQIKNLIQPVIARYIAECERCSQDVQQLIEKIQGRVEEQKVRGRIYFVFKEQDIRELSNRLEEAKSSLTMAYTIQISMSTQYLLYQNEEHKKAQDQMLSLGEKVLDQLQVRASPGDQEIVVTGSAVRMKNKVTRLPGGQVVTSYRFRFKFCLPYRLCSRVWDASLSLTRSRLNLDIRTYNIVPESSKVFYLCERGDLAGIQQLLQLGKAGLLDMRPGRRESWETLVECAAYAGHIHICRYLWSQTTWPDNTIVLERALNSFAYGHHKRKYMVRAVVPVEPHDAYRVFAEEPDFDVDTDFLDDKLVTYGNWLGFCPNMESMKVMLRYLWPNWHSISIQNRLDFVEYALKPNREFCADASEFLQFLGLRASDPRLAAIRGTKRGTSVLHLVVTFLLHSLRDGKTGQDWIKLGIEVLKNGADASGVKTEASRSRATPLLQCIGAPELVTFRYERNLEKMLERLHLWINVVYEAGLDLCQYGAREAEVWKSLSTFQQADTSNLPCQAVIVEQLLFGPRPEDWTVVVRNWMPPVNGVVFELRIPPGSFPHDPRVPTKINWQPAAAERNEGHWEKVTARTLQVSHSRPMTLQHAIAHFQDSEPELIKILKDTQDDAGAVALLLLQQQAAQSRRSCAPRSRSQSPWSLGRDFREYKLYPRQWKIREWLPYPHFCPFDSKWSLQHCHSNMNIWPSMDVGLTKLQNCVRGVTEGLASAPGSKEWLTGSFLASIACCQDDWPLYKLQRTGHTGSLDCPHKCGAIDLERLSVPKELEEYHPRRRWKPIDLDC